MARLRFLTAGESHGPRLTAILEGIPAGLTLTAERIDAELARRQRGYGRGGRMKIEHDRVEISAGVRGGQTLGSPIVLTVENRDFESWRGRMGAEPFDAPPEPLTRPRPGHADLAGGIKYERHDLRDVLERASARETAARTAAGAVARVLLEAIVIEIYAHVVQIGEVVADPAGGSHEELRARARASDLACADAAAEARMREAIHAASHAGDTLGQRVIPDVLSRRPDGLDDLSFRPRGPILVIGGQRGVPLHPTGGLQPFEKNPLFVRFTG
jgi:chorismate synthase